MKTETWLHTNRRALALGILLPAVVALLTTAGAAGAFGEPTAAAKTALWIAAGFAAAMVLLLVAQLRRPRLARAGSEMLVYLRAGNPIRVPLEIVECFLLGQGPSMLPGRKHERTETTTVVIRLAERAAEWSHVDVKPALGRWCDGYITLHGTWCEPLSVELVKRLNTRLHEAQRERNTQERAS